MPPRSSSAPPIPGPMPSGSQQAVYVQQQPQPLAANMTSKQLRKLKKRNPYEYRVVTGQIPPNPNAVAYYNANGRQPPQMQMHQQQQPVVAMAATVAPQLAQIGFQNTARGVGSIVRPPMVGRPQQFFGQQQHQQQIVMVQQGQPVGYQQQPQMMMGGQQNGQQQQMVVAVPVNRPQPVRPEDEPLPLYSAVAE
ncbi:hypothetical protein HK101_008326 [Irineochytrium annulatum]|nr:hypothetical protein HK101_008326 [Irineochytrium annulatum]